MKLKHLSWQGFNGVAATRFVAATLVAAGLFAAVSPARAGDAVPASNATAQAEVQAEQQAEVGRKTYTSYCTRCHGIRLVTGGLGFDLRTFPSGDKARFVRSVTNGLRAMPALGGLLTPEDIDAIWAYIGSVNGWSPAPPAPVPAQ